MNNIMLTQISIEELKELFRQVIREEMSPKVSEGATIEKPITGKELAAHLGLSEQTINRMRVKGKIPFFTVGTAIRYKLTKVLAAIETKRKNQC